LLYGFSLCPNGQSNNTNSSEKKFFHDTNPRIASIVSPAHCPKKCDSQRHSGSITTRLIEASSVTSLCASS
jgi:hypothetical protein